MWALPLTHGNSRPLKLELKTRFQACNTKLIIIYTLEQVKYNKMLSNKIFLMETHPELYSYVFLTSVKWKFSLTMELY